MSIIFFSTKTKQSVSLLVLWLKGLGIVLTFMLVADISLSTHYSAIFPKGEKKYSTFCRHDGSKINPAAVTEVPEVPAAGRWRRNQSPLDKSNKNLSHLEKL